MFNHVQGLVQLPKIETTNVNRKRFYITPEGNKYPSITTVLSVRNKQGLFEWRKRVGEEVANYIARTAAARGTKVHQMCEDHLNNDFDDDKHKKDFHAYHMFGAFKKILENIDNIHFQECGLWSDKYGVAGRVDCIGEYKGKLSIIDFKTSTNPRKEEYNENYYIQCSAYAEMYEEQTGTPIDQIVVLVVTADGEVQEFVRQKQDYLPLLSETIETFNTQNNLN
jgi:genome maintenance exonuclease 1|tara:strand:+ start:1100 stop:1771 length:672 start_codon:yes stop_codon:yes gene_type:complete